MHSAAQRIMMRYKDQNTKEWHDTRERLYQLTASEVPDALGAGFGSRQKLFKRKIARQEGIEFELNPYLEDIMSRGHEDEPIIVRMLAERLAQLGVIGKIFTTGIWEYKKDPRIGASPDRRFYDLANGYWVNVEIKSRQTNRNGELTEPRKPTLENWIQMQTQMQCTRAAGCIYACANVRRPEWPMVVCFVARSDEAWDKCIYPKICEFLHCLDKKEEPPRLKHKPDDLLMLWYKESVNDAPPPPCPQTLSPILETNAIQRGSKSNCREDQGDVAK